MPARRLSRAELKRLQKKLCYFKVFREQKALRTGITDLILAHPFFVNENPHNVRRAINAYVHLPRYLQTIAAGGRRYNLHGKPVGWITRGEAKSASDQLKRQ